ncbi:MAG: IS21 family transposase [Gemmatimonadales bacterium]
MIAPATEAEILRLYHAEQWKIGTIATQLGVHHSTVRRVLAQAGIPAGTTAVRPSIAEPFIPFLVATLEQYPTLRASRLYAMVRQRGYPGRPDHFRAIVARYRPRPKAEAYLRLRTLPGEQGQVDWAHFGKIQIGRAVRPLMGFVMVLAWSRHVFLRFYLGAHLANFLRGHGDAFTFYDAVPRVLLYDNLKSAVLERRRDAIRFHPTLLELAAHYRFLPRPVAVARGNEKGRVERAIRFARESFFAARAWTDLADLNAQALQWCRGIAADRRCPENRARTVRDAFAEEHPRLLPLPANPFPTEERQEVHVGRTPYVRFDLNDYSVPHTAVRQTLVVVASLDTVRILDGNDVIVAHARSFDRGAQIENPTHIQALTDAKREAREHRGIDRLYHAVPRSQPLFAAVAGRGGNLGGLTRGLLPLLDRFGAAALDHAIREALAHDTPHLSALRHILDRNQHAEGKLPPIAVELPNDPRVRDLVVHPHALDTYDHLEDDDDEPHR